jgi:stearoyl-CoA desaturase (delta-9 desaturase)
LERSTSVCHYFGTRGFAREDRSTNAFWLGLRRWEIDPSAWIIGALEKLRLARNVVRISPERQGQSAA